MQFNSLEFLFQFLPIFLIVYYLVPNAARKYVLCAGSLVFYASACADAPWCLALLAALTLLTYALGRALHAHRRRVLLAISVALPVGLLVFFKLYHGGALLPVGLSFYVFQMLAYLTDVYRGRVEAQRNLAGYGAQVLMFPKLLSGPLVAPEKLARQEKTPCVCVRTFHSGLQELIFGLFLKVGIADRLGGLWAQARIAGYDAISAPFAWMALVAYALQLYFDFYGYSLMAMGLGHMLGYHLPRNFRDPYGAASVSEFYRRWHVTLGAWFREYLYIPLGGNRKGTARTVLNLAIVWAATGFWHGTGGNYLLWAGFLLVLIVNEKLWLRRALARAPAVGHIYTVFVILLSWVPFAIGDFGQMTQFLGKLFGMGSAINPRDFVPWLRDYAALLLAGVALALPVTGKLVEKLRRTVVGDILLFALFWIAVYLIATSAQDPFLYFQY